MKKIYNISIQLLRFITFPVWFPIGLLIVGIVWGWKFCANCPHCGWICNCPKGFGVNK